MTEVHEFSYKWGLSVNADKSKVMVFSKSGRMPKNQYIFTIGQAILENVNQYIYLRVNISANGKFLAAEKNLSLKASRALFSIKQSILDSTINSFAVLRIFDSLIKPITIYNSQICIKHVTITSPLMQCWKCHLKVIMILIRYLQDFPNMF